MNERLAIGLVATISASSVPAMLWLEPAHAQSGTPHRELVTTTTAVSVTTSAVPDPAAAPALRDGGAMFVVGDVQLPIGQPGQLFVVAAGRLDGSGHLPLVIRNNSEVTVYDIHVELTFTDASGGEVSASYFIPTAGVAPGEWTFGQNAVPADNLDQASNIQLRMNGSTDPGDFLGLDVTTAELRDGAVAGTVTNNSRLPVGDFNFVNVACFDGQEVSLYESATAQPLSGRLRPGESARFSTTKPIDPAKCTAFAAYAVGLPES